MYDSISLVPLSAAYRIRQLQGAVAQLTCTQIGGLSHSIDVLSVKEVFMM
jgi:hypothetical protein